MGRPLAQRLVAMLAIIGDIAHADDGPCIFVPLQLVSEANQREHHMVKHRRKKQQQLAVHYALMAVRPTVLFPLLVTLTRVGGRKMDDDNNVSSMKACRDAVAKYLGVDDGDERRVTWAYGQRPGGKVKGCEIRMEAR